MYAIGTGAGGDRITTAVRAITATTMRRTTALTIRPTTATCGRSPASTGGLITASTTGATNGGLGLSLTFVYPRGGPSSRAMRGWGVGQWRPGGPKKPAEGVAPRIEGGHR